MGNPTNISGLKIPNSSYTPSTDPTAIHGGIEGELYERTNIVLEDEQLVMVLNFFDGDKPLMEQIEKVTKVGGLQWFDTLSAYKTGNMCYWDNKLYVCTSNTAPSVDFPYGSFLEVSNTVQLFSPSLTYKRKDIAIFDERIHVCSTDVIDGQLNLAFNNRQWIELSEYRGITAYNNKDRYILDELVLYDERVYKCVRANNKGGFNPADWGVLLISKGIEHYDPTISYGFNRICVYNKKIFNHINTTTTGVFNYDDWTLISPTVHLSEFNLLKKYTVGMGVLKHTRLWVCTEESTEVDFTTDRFEEVARPMAVYRTDTDYKVGEMVIEDRLVYICITNSPRGPFTPDRWRDVDIDKKNLYEYDGTRAYDAEDICIYNRKIYRAWADLSAIEEFRPDQWQEISKETGTIYAHASDKDYKRNAIVRNSNRIFVAPTDISAGEFDEEQWHELSVVTGQLLYFDPQKDYKVGDVVINVDDFLFYCIEDSEASPLMVTDHWKGISPWTGEMTYVRPYGLHDTAEVGEIREYLGVIYYCRTKYDPLQEPYNPDNAFSIPQKDQFQPLTTIIPDISNVRHYTKHVLTYIEGILGRVFTQRASTLFDFTEEQNIERVRLETERIAKDLQPYHSDQNYFQGDITLSTDRRIYQAKTDLDDTITPSDHIHWNEVGRKKPLRAFESKTYYVKDDTVLFGNRYYRLTADATYGTFNYDDWVLFNGIGEVKEGAKADVLYSGAGYFQLSSKKWFFNTETTSIPEPVIDFAISTMPVWRATSNWGTRDYTADLGILYPYDMFNYFGTPPPRITDYPNDQWHDLFDTSSITSESADALLMRHLYIEGTERIQDDYRHWSPTYSPLSSSSFSHGETYGQSKPQGYGAVRSPFEIPYGEGNHQDNLRLNNNYFTFNTYGDSLGFGKFRGEFVSTVALYKRIRISIEAYNNYLMESTYPQLLDTRIVEEATDADGNTIPEHEEVISFVMRTKGKFRVENDMMQVMITDIDWFDNKTETQARYLTAGTLLPQHTEHIRDSNYAFAPARTVGQEIISIQALADMDGGTDVKSTLQLGSMQFYVNTGGSISVPQGFNYKDETNNLIHINT